MSSGTDNKRFFIHTLGCKVNQYESQAMREILMRRGYKECLAKDLADIYIVNTCTVTQAADRESRYSIGLFHRTNPDARIVVAGCYVERDADEISFLPGVAHILKNNEKNSIAEILEGHRSLSPASPTPNHAPLTITSFKDHDKAFVKIQDGCENACAYCKVPLVRGNLRSKPLDNALKEIDGLVKNGFREIVLTGICLGAWGKDLESYIIAKGAGLSGLTLIDILKQLDEVEGDFRVRLSSLEPRYVTDELINIVAKNKRVCKHLHIPLQSGDDEILRRMNRRYTAFEYKTLIEKIRHRIDDIAITTDILVGFPGESEINFKNTVNLVKEILPSRTHIFTFSKREGTPACDMPDEVGKGIARKRYYQLNASSLGASYLFRRRFLNKKLDILVEARRERHSGLLVGYSDNYIKVLFKGPDELMGHIVPVKIEDVNLLHTLGSYD